MSDEQIKQRIAYLVEHGGVWDDPHDDIRRKVTINRILAGLALVIVGVDLVIDWMLL
jgi:hypothetical protein